MKIFTEQEAIEDIVEGASDSHPYDLDTDLDGQLIIYTGIYRWKDGTYRDEAET